jgi:hypothetical protein
MNVIDRIKQRIAYHLLDFVFDNYVRRLKTKKANGEWDRVTPTKIRETFFIYVGQRYDKVWDQ